MGPKKTDWFTTSVTETLSHFSVDDGAGLSDSEASKIKEEKGANVLAAKKKKSIFTILLSQLNDWLIYVLLAAVVITFFMGEYVDAVIILLVITLNGAIGTFQEIKAGKAIDALMKMSSPKALVKRSGQTKEIDSTEIVPGDIIILDAGRHSCRSPPYRNRELTNRRILAYRGIITGH